ncbi:hypothetical protein [Chryseobacterium taihuense]|uniref:Glycosyltransferase RgtA/B/C/D-like domain-containing protein n=1 Tax=Chryseobacterium taihuense TaxID=1141221 RepID=A0ABY0R0C2_9FLAO|nr:hypothetical protein [Chryseobacterium taihuense]SDM21577.1 hypothetical protein SAMN05216273_11758 [Chryseobacterium taihuense]
MALKNKSLFLVTSFFAAVCLGYYFNSVRQTDGSYTYLIDDAYIHLAIAKNFALHKVWGITQYQFSSTSSSPLFTFIISVLIRIFGDNDLLPLYFNMFCGFGIVYSLVKYFSAIFNTVNLVVLSVLFTLFFSVLHVQLLSGMEHIFHVLLIVVNIWCFSRMNSLKSAAAGFYLSLMLMGLVRFESMFYFVILSALFLFAKKWKESVAVLLAGFIPVLIFCCFNYLQDGYFFPNSVVVKGTKFNFGDGFLHQLRIIFLNNFLLNISFYKIGVFPILMSVFIVGREIYKKKKMNEIIQTNFLLIVFSLLMICHSLFAELKGSFRYEAYILVGFSMAIIPKISGIFGDFKAYIKREKILSVLVLMNMLLLCYKTAYAHRMLDKGGKNIYEQQMQSAKFLHTYYNNSKVVANDIGAISYYTDIHLLDTAGLGSKETMRFNENKKKADRGFEEFLTQYTADHQYEIAIIYDEWLNGFVPKTWKKVAVLTIQDGIMVAKNSVSVYAVDGHVDQLRRNIKNFSWNRNVKVVLTD